MNPPERTGLSSPAPSVTAERETSLRPISRVGVLLSCAAAIGAFYGIFLLDVPIARFVRSLQHPLGYLIDPRLARWSSLGDWIGGGIQLVVLSLGLWTAGWALRRRSWELAGLQSLFAHAVVALLTNVLKRSLGRPRPKFSHAGEFQWWPSLDNGFDSFPSGHASASFAVAAVLAVHFPRARWGWYGLAAAVSCSRIFRSAHFPTDVIAGAMIGFTIGWVIGHPLGEWRRSLATTVTKSAPWIVGMFSLLWIASRPIDRDLLAVGSFMAGTMLTLAGVAGRFLTGVHGLVPDSDGEPWGWNGLAFGGLLLATASIPVAVLGGAALLGYWQNRPRGALRRAPASTARAWQRWALEGIVAVAFLAALVLVWALPGLFPLH